MNHSWAGLTGLCTVRVTFPNHCRVCHWPGKVAIATDTQLTTNKQQGEGMEGRNPLPPGPEVEA